MKFWWTIPFELIDAQHNRVTFTWRLIRFWQAISREEVRFRFSAQRDTEVPFDSRNIQAFSSNPSLSNSFEAFLLEVAQAKYSDRSYTFKRFDEDTDTGSRIGNHCRFFGRCDLTKRIETSLQRRVTVLCRVLEAFRDVVISRNSAKLTCHVFFTSLWAHFRLLSILLSPYFICSFTSGGQIPSAAPEHV